MVAVMLKTTNFHNDFQTKVETFFGENFYVNK